MRLFGALLTIASLLNAAFTPTDLTRARDVQDRPQLDRYASEAAATANSNPQNAEAQYKAALAYSYVAEVAAEFKDKGKARSASDEGMKFGEKAVSLDKKAENFRILGTLCGHAVPGGGLVAIKYGRCALDSLNKAIELDNRSALAYLGRGVGYSYLPEAFGGGIEPALKDIRKALDLDPKLAEGWLWMGVVLRKANRNAEAKQALTKAVALNPARVWAKQQLEKTPVK